MNENEINAFPVLNLSDGMSLRDYFAAKAMQAIISKTPVVLVPIDAPAIDNETYGAAVSAYDYADAMLQARQE